MIHGFVVPSKDISPERKSELEAILRRSNLVLRSHHAAAKAKGYAGGRRVFFAEVLRSGGFVAGISIPATDMREIRQIKEVEWEVLCAYSALMNKVARRWKRCGFDNSISEEDIDSMAFEAFLKAICCFTKERTRFSTYLFKCVSRSISEAKTEATNPMSVPKRIIRLRRKLEKSMCETGLDLHSAVEELNLSKKTAKMLLASMCRVNSSASVGMKDAELVLVEDDTAGDPPLKIPGPEDLGLSGLELMVFEEFMRKGDRMNLSEISRATLNPKTGKPYSKMALSLAWRRARDKMSSYGKVA